MSLSICSHPNPASLVTEGLDSVRKSTRFWKSHLDRGEGKNPMGSKGELLINLMTAKEPKRLIGSDQNGTWVGYGAHFSP
jgi:hypothetical protein